MKRRFWKRMAAGVLTVSLALPGTFLAAGTETADISGIQEAEVAESVKVQAAEESDDIVIQDTEPAPLEELKEILEKQKTETKSSLLKETLGINQLCEAFKKDGMQFKLSIAPVQGTMETLDLEDIPDDLFGELYFQHDPVSKKWLLGVNGGMEGEAALTCRLYGDTEKMLLASPQFSEKAVGIREGSFMEQYEGSALKELLGEIPDIPDIDLVFYPEDDAFSDIDVPTEGLQKNLEEKVEEMENSVQVEKEEITEEESIYHLTCSTSDVMDIYRYIINGYVSLFTDSGLMDYGDARELEDQAEEMVGTMGSMMGEEITIDFQVVNDGLSDIEISMDVEDDFKGYLDYEIIFDDPTDPFKTFDVLMKVRTADGVEMMSMWITKQTKTSETASETTVTMMLKEEGEVVYWDVPVMISYDAETGDLDASFSIEADGDKVALTMDSTFQKVAPGFGFVWKLDSLALEVDEKSIGVTGRLAVMADPGVCEMEEDAIMLLEASQGELFILMNEVMMNMENWVAQFEPETEPETGRSMEMEWKTESESEWETEPESIEETKPEISWEKWSTGTEGMS